MNSRCAEYDNSSDIYYVINNIMPKLKEQGNKLEYNSKLNEIINRCKVNISTTELCLCDCLILRVVDTLHTGKVKSEFVENENHYYLSSSITKDIRYNKVKKRYSCYIKRRKLHTDYDKKYLVYSPEEKLMLYIFVSSYLQRLSGKSIQLTDNFTYIDVEDIHQLFGNQIESAGKKVGIKNEKKAYYSNIINKLKYDDIEIRLQDEEHLTNDRIYNNWFKSIYELKNYDGSIKGYFYSFGDLGTELFPTTNHPTKCISLSTLNIENRYLNKFEIARYIIYKIVDKAKDIRISTMLEELYDFENGALYIDELYRRNNPNNVKYLERFISIVYEAVSNLQTMYDGLNMYYNKELLPEKYIEVYSRMNCYDKISLKVTKPD
mgnify:CR=1 FL=1